MKDLALQKPFLQNIETTSPQAKNYYALRKLFSDYLNKLNVPFYDSCCPNISTQEIFPLRWNDDSGNIQYYDGSSWIDYTIDIPDVPVEFTSISSISDLGTYDSSDTPVIQVDGVGIYTPGMGTVDGYRVVNGSSGQWVLQNAASNKNKIPQDYPIIAELRPGIISSGHETNTTNDAMSTATITNEGGFDQIEVTGSTSASWIKFPNQTVCDNDYKAKLVIKVNAMGATAPLIGIGGFGVQETSDTGSVNNGLAYINLLTKNAFRWIENANNACPWQFSSSGTLCADGDTLEITFDNDTKMGWWVFTVRNITTNEMVTGIQTISPPATARGFTLIAKNLGLILADGTYTILEYKVQSSVPRYTLGSIIGDSYACGYNVNTQNNVATLVNDALPFDRISCHAGNGAYTTTMRKHQFKEIMKIKPRFVFFLQILNLYWGYFDDGDANQTIFDNDMEIMLKSIIAYGGTPVFFTWQTTGGFINGNSAAWQAKVTSMQNTYGQLEYIQLDNEALQLNSSSHPNAADNRKIANKIIEYLKGKNVL